MKNNETVDWVNVQSKRARR